MTTYPASASAQRTIKLLGYLSPKFPDATFDTLWRNDIIDYYLETVFPTSVLGEPDSADRAKNVLIHSDFWAAHVVGDVTIISNNAAFWFGRITTGLFIDGEGEWTGTTAFISMSTAIQNALLDKQSLTSSQKTDLGNNFAAYAFTNQTDASNWLGTYPANDIGNDYRNVALDIDPVFIDMINQMDILVADYYTTRYSLSCTLTNDVPDQPNSPTISSVAHNEIVLLIGESICYHNDVIDYYEVWRRVSGGGAYAIVGTHTNLTDLHFTDGSVLPETAYEYYCIAHNAQGDSVISTVVEGITLVDPMTGEPTPESLEDFLASIYSSISGALSDIFISVTGIGNDKLFEMKMLEILMGGATELALTDIPLMATNTLEVQKQIKTIAASAIAEDIGE